MGKRKEIKFLCKDGQTREGRQDGVMFWIRKDQKREQDGLPAFYVAANDIKGKGRTIYTAGHEYFTLEGQKNFASRSWPERPTWRNEKPDTRRRT